MWSNISIKRSNAVLGDSWQLFSNMKESWPEVIKLFSCSTQLCMKFFLLINVKMPTIVGILTFTSMINTTSERLKPRYFFICRYFSFYEQLKFHAQLSWAWKKFYNLRAWFIWYNCQNGVFFFLKWSGSKCIYFCKRKKVQIISFSVNK